MVDFVRVEGHEEVSEMGYANRVVKICVLANVRAEFKLGEPVRRHHTVNQIIALWRDTRARIEK